MVDPKKRETYFRQVWQRASERGACDEVGSMEYQRLFMLWVKTGRPAGVYAFIRKHANLRALPFSAPDWSDPL